MQEESCFAFQTKSWENNFHLIVKDSGWQNGEERG
jgi:hypothetical protein